MESTFGREVVIGICRTRDTHISTKRINATGLGWKSPSTGVDLTISSNDQCSAVQNLNRPSISALAPMKRQSALEQHVQSGYCTPEASYRMTVDLRK